MLSRNQREGLYAGKFKMSHGHGRMKHWRTEYDCVSLRNRHKNK